ncbi:Os03g0794050 [Oryza sativa Japonica Group]|uniref:Os03g0794050 protein n=1 Tax=Oryza sativa subsp. japonica TaxID=39947 RepID=A0A0P0W440_ORYSJ|nr:Os03g0794050 [Oryza sativa Japonica Group]
MEVFVQGTIVSMSDDSVKERGIAKWGFDTLATLVAWMIWKDRNNRVFNLQQRPWTEIARAMAAEAELWRLARAVVPALGLYPWVP